MKIISLIISLLFLSIISCKSKEEMMQDFANCALNQVRKPYVTYDARGPDKFSNSGLVWYCRAQAGLSKSSTIYVSWKKISKPKVGAHVFGIIKDNGASVSSDCLGVIVRDNPPYVVQGDESKGTLAYKPFKPNPNYIRTEFHYVDF